MSNVFILKESIMDKDRRNAVALGGLVIAGMVSGILSSVPALEFPDYMTALPLIETQVLAAVFFQAAMAISYAYIAVLIYPFIQRYDKGLANAYFGFRIIGAGFLFVGIGSLLLLLWLSQAFVASGQADVSHMLILGELLRRGRDILNHIGLILPWSIGGLILYYSFFKMRIVPQWLAIWGLAGSALTLLSTMLYMLTFIEMATPLYFALNMPTASGELVLAFHLIIKGFDYRISFDNLA